jgi:hypothetical protein
MTSTLSLVDSRPMERSMERWKRLAILLALLTTGAVVVALYSQFQQLLLHPFAFIGSVLFAGILSIIMLRVALVPEQRYVGWARAIGGPNGRWFFLILILLWTVGMAFLASLGLGGLQTGALAFVGLLIGIFLFMGFIWSVIGG